MTDEKQAVETTSVVVQVEMQIATKEAGGDLAAAAKEMIKLVTEYLSNEDGSFMTDYGASAAQIAQARIDGDWSEVTWGGFDGPYVVSTSVRPVHGIADDNALVSHAHTQQQEVHP